MRFLSVGQLGHGQTCLERYRYLEKAGWHGRRFNILPYLTSGGRLKRALQYRVLDGPEVRRFNAELVQFVRNNKNIDVVWVDKGRWLFYSTLKAIKELTNALLVHYTPDPAFTVHTSRHFRKCLSLYDLCITTKKYELDAYREAGAQRVIFTLQGIDDRFSKCGTCAQLNARSRAGAVFIGHCEPHYVNTLSALADGGIPLKIWGSGWNKLKTKSSSLCNCIQGGPVLGIEYPRALSQGIIGIGLLSKMYPDAFTTRTFEVPAAGCLLLAERTDEHMSLFEEGIEAEFYSDLDELVDKARYYLVHDDERREIAARGRSKALSEYTWGHVMRPAVELVEKLVREKYVRNHG